MAKDEPAEESETSKDPDQDGMPDISDPQKWPLSRVLDDPSLRDAARKLADSIGDEPQIIITNWD